MSTGTLVAIIVAGVLIVGAVVLFFVGRRMQNKQNAQRAEMEAAAQVVSVLVIDKKKMKLKDANLPQQVMEAAPKIGKFMKYPMVKVKIGPKIMTLIAEDSIFDIIPVKKEIKATISGLYIMEVRGIRGNLDAKPEKKGFFKRLKEKATKK